MLLNEGFTPGFKANTDAAFDFDREYSRGMQTNKDVFEKCLIWAVAPSLAEFDRVTTRSIRGSIRGDQSGDGSTIDN